MRSILLNGGDFSTILWVMDTSPPESFISSGWVLLEHFGNFTVLESTYGALG